MGIWHHVLDGDFKIAETWFLRQLSSDEVDSKVRLCDIQITDRACTAPRIHMCSDNNDAPFDLALLLCCCVEAMQKSQHRSFIFFGKKAATRSVVHQVLLSLLYITV